MKHFKYLVWLNHTSGDWEIINGYEQGYMQVFEECEPNDVGAFKCWVIEN